MFTKYSIIAIVTYACAIFGATAAPPSLAPASRQSPQARGKIDLAFDTCSPGQIGIITSHLEHAALIALNAADRAVNGPEAG